MREPLTTLVTELEVPSEAARNGAIAAREEPGTHDRLMAEWPCFTAIERGVAADLAPAQSMRIAAWNLERCKKVEASAEILRGAGADIVLATEMDHGMARSDQRHTTRDLARLLGFHYIFGTEFVELGTGDSFETAEFAGMPNRGGLHGNALLSRFPIRSPALIPLDAGGDWFTRSPKGDGQYRVGGRMAMAGQIDMSGQRLTLCAVHYESEGDAAGRAVQTERLLTGLAQLYGAGPLVIGGDLNTRDFAATGMTGRETLDAPQTVEPSFAHFAAAGLDWRSANTPLTTTRIAPGRIACYPERKLDWLFVRGVHALAACVVPALGPRGEYLSDHELILSEIEP